MNFRLAVVQRIVPYSYPSAQRAATLSMFVINRNRRHEHQLAAGSKQLQNTGSDRTREHKARVCVCGWVRGVCVWGVCVVCVGVCVCVVCVRTNGNTVKAMKIS